MSHARFELQKALHYACSPLIICLASVRVPPLIASVSCRVSLHLPLASTVDMRFHLELGSTSPRFCCS